MYWAYQADRWDHTITLVNVHAGKQAKAKNPYRRKTKAQPALMTPEELAAMAAALTQRNN